MGELGSLEVDAHYSERTHFCAAEHFKVIHYAFGLTAAIGSAATALSAVKDHTTLAAILATITAVASAIVAFVQPAAVAERHVSCGRNLNALKLRVRQAKNIAGHPHSGVTDLDLQTMLGELTQQKADLTTDAPTTGPIAFWRAQRKFQAGHYDTEDVSAGDG